MRTSFLSSLITSMMVMPIVGALLGGVFWVFSGTPIVVGVASMMAVGAVASLFAEDAPKPAADQEETKEEPHVFLEEQAEPVLRPAARNEALESLQADLFEPELVEPMAPPAQARKVDPLKWRPGRTGGSSRRESDEMSIQSWANASIPL